MQRDLRRLEQRLFRAAAVAATVFAIALGSACRANSPSAPTRAAGPGARIMLFGGRASDLTKNWLKRGTQTPASWVLDGRAMIAHGGDIQTKESFEDFHLHVEFRVPLMPDKHGQERGNSGIGLQGRYEIQVLDSYGIADPGSGDCGAVYSEVAPLVNACKPPLQWETYDIYFRAPRLDNSGAVTEKPRVTVILNGLCVQNNTEIQGPTGIQYGQFKGIEASGPIILQDHGNTVEYRNVWIRPLPLHGASHY